MDVDLGLRTENLITFQLVPPQAGYNAGQSRAFFDRVEQNLAALPGVTGVISASYPLLADSSATMSLGIEGYSGNEQQIQFNNISPGFFGLMRIPLISGREFTERDNLFGHKVVIINEQFAENYFPGQNPIGRKVYLSNPMEQIPAEAEIVGIVEDFHDSSVRQTPSEYIYMPWLQNDPTGFGAVFAGFLRFYIRTSLPPNSLMAQVRQVLHDLDEQVPLNDLMTMEDQVKLNTHNDWMMVQLAGLSASLAVALAMIGLYGTMAYSVVRRKREFGIRIAVGAQSSVIRRMVLREMGIILILGLIVGIPVALAICNVANNQWLGIAPRLPMFMEDQSPENRLFGVSAFDPAIVAIASMALGIAASIATYLPAWRASRTDPMIALRSE
jgi:ABC-type antimicrobial peptide transport system permease subunit